MANTGFGEGDNSGARVLCAPKVVDAHALVIFFFSSRRRHTRFDCDWSSDVCSSDLADQPAWDPLRAEKDLEVGQYYMKKGDLDAAIDRFQDATVAKPGYAVPFRFLGEAQEKKGLRKQAIKSYQRYLDLYPHAEDGDKVRKKLEKLYKEVEKEKKN